MQNKRQTGSGYEKIAAAYFIEKGFEIVECNYRERRSEIDLIARDGEYLVFIEVKYRSSAVLGMPEEAVDKRKQQQIRKGAAHYLYTHGYGEDTPCRFDVLAILGEQITWIPDAF